jgi:hypothetical protein
VTAGSSFVTVNLHKKHASVTSMYNEWNGIGGFPNKPFPGGLCALESEGREWRNHFKSKENEQFSRFRRAMQAVACQRQENGMEIAAVLAEFDVIMAEPGVGNLSNLVGALQHINYIQKGPTRKPRRSPTASV